MLFDVRILRMMFDVYLLSFVGDRLWVGVCRRCLLCVVCVALFVAL